MSDLSLQDLPPELLVRTGSFLRAVDLSNLQRTNTFFAFQRHLHHRIVEFCADHVYPRQYTEGFEDQPISTTLTPPTPPPFVTKSRSSSLGSYEEAKALRRSSRSVSLGSLEEAQDPTPVATPQRLFTFEHLHNMELLVVARVLSSPEPATGYVVSKAWCKSALVWLESRQPQPEKRKGKKAKKRQKEKRRRAQSNTTTKSVPPNPNVNSDITCAHDQLQHLTSSRSARARRRLVDKKAWKILKRLYPESTPLPSFTGECLLCRAEACQAQKALADQKEAQKQERKLPLKDPTIRRFYTRTRGFPEYLLKERQVEEDSKLPATPKKSTSSEDLHILATNTQCPLVDGAYYVLPRSWCHGWRRFMKTGEGGLDSKTYFAPDAAVLLCHSHKLALLPPHLESFLYGESHQLLESSSSLRQQDDSTMYCLPVGRAPPGMGPSQESVQAMRALGMSPDDIRLQLSAMWSLESQQRTTETQADTPSRNELLDRENHAVVEIVSEAEFRALERYWPHFFALRFVVSATVVSFCTPVCRSCDATGRQCRLSIKNRSRRKNHTTEKSSPRLEY